MGSISDLKSSFPPKRFWTFYSGQCLLSQIDEETLECSSSPLLTISNEQIRAIRDKLEYIDDEFVAKVPVKYLFKIMDVLERGKSDTKKRDQELLLYAPIATQFYEMVKVNHVAAYSILFIFLEALEIILSFMNASRKWAKAHRYRQLVGHTLDTLARKCVQTHTN